MHKDSTVSQVPETCFMSCDQKDIYIYIYRYIYTSSNSPCDRDPGHSRCFATLIWGSYSFHICFTRDKLSLFTDEKLLSIYFMYSILQYNNALMLIITWRTFAMVILKVVICMKKKEEIDNSTSQPFFCITQSLFPQ